MSYLFIDANYYLFKYHHAINLKDKHGVQVGGVFGLIKLLIHACNEYKNICVVFDTLSSDTHRKSIFNEYKKNRPEFPSQIIHQMRMVQSIIPDLGVSCIRAYDFEADDVIATLVRLYKDKGPCTIYTRDKDLYSLCINKNVFVNDAGKNVDWPVNKPELIQGFLALAGDASDNIPGVPLIGPKIGIALLEYFNCLKQHPRTYNYDHSFLDDIDTSNKHIKKGINLLKNNWNYYVLSWNLIELVDTVPYISSVLIHLKDKNKKSLLKKLSIFPYLIFLLKDTYCNQGLVDLNNKCITFESGSSMFITDGKSFSKINERIYNNCITQEDILLAANILFFQVNDLYSLLRYFNFFNYYTISYIATAIYTIYESIKALMSKKDRRCFSNLIKVKKILKNKSDIYINKNNLSILKDRYLKLVNNLSKNIYSYTQLKSILPISELINIASSDDNLVNISKRLSLMHTVVNTDIPLLLNYQNQWSFDKFLTPICSLNLNYAFFKHMHSNFNQVFRINKEKCFISFDMYQLAVFIIANCSRDTKMIDVYKKGDFYSYFGNILGEDRINAKILYLQSIFCNDLKTIDNNFKNVFLLEHSKAFLFLNNIHDICLFNGYIYNMFSRKIYVSKYESPIIHFIDSSISTIIHDITIKYGDYLCFVGRVDNRLIFSIDEHKSNIFLRLIHDKILSYFTFDAPIKVHSCLSYNIY